MGCNHRDDNNDVAGIFNHGKNKVRATIEFDDLCKAVRRCIVEDLVAGAQDDEEDKCKCKKHRGNWLF